MESGDKVLLIKDQVLFYQDQRLKILLKRVEQQFLKQYTSTFEEQNYSELEIQINEFIQQQIVKNQKFNTIYYLPNLNILISEYYYKQLLIEITQDSLGDDLVFTFFQRILMHRIKLKDMHKLCEDLMENQNINLIIQRIYLTQIQKLPQQIFAQEIEQFKMIFIRSLIQLEKIRFSQKDLIFKSSKIFFLICSHDKQTDYQSFKLILQDSLKNSNYWQNQKSNHENKQKSLLVDKLQQIQIPETNLKHYHELKRLLQLSNDKQNLDCQYIPQFTIKKKKKILKNDDLQTKITKQLYNKSLMLHLYYQEQLNKSDLSKKQ